MSPTSYRYFSVIFLEDWGPYKKDQKINHLVVDFNNDEVQHYTTQGSLIDYTPYKLVPRDEGTVGNADAPSSVEPVAHPRHSSEVRYERINGSNFYRLVR